MAQLPHEREFGDYGEWPGRDVRDSGGDRVGGVREIYLDRDTGRPEWVLVEVEDDAPRFVPLAGATVESGAIHLAHPASVVRNAPSIGPEPHIDNEQERELYAHYGLGYSEEASASGLPAEEPDEPPLWSEAATEEWQAPAGEPEPDVAAPGVPGPALSEPPEAGDEPAPEVPGLPGPDLAVAGALTADVVAQDPFAAPPGLPDLTPPDDLTGPAGEPARAKIGTADLATPAEAPAAAEPDAAPPAFSTPPPPEPPRAFPPPPDPGTLPVPGTRRRLGLAGGAAVLALVLFVVARRLRG